MILPDNGVEIFGLRMMSLGAQATGSHNIPYVILQARPGFGSTLGAEWVSSGAVENGRPDHEPDTC